MVKKWRITIPGLSGAAQRWAYLYLPDGWESGTQRYPVMYMFDGHNVFFDDDATYGKSWGMAEYLDRTHKQLIVVAVECNHEGNKRLEEYSPVDFNFPDVGQIHGRGREYMQWLIETLKVEIDAHYPTLADREHTIICGSSMGGLMALYAAVVYNQVFQKAACLSPSLWVDKLRILDLISEAEINSDTCIYMDYGSAELSNHVPSSDALISIARLLLTRRVNVALRIIPGGTHTEMSWERQIPAFMECLGL